MASRVGTCSPGNEPHWTKLSYLTAIGFPGDPLADPRLNLVIDHARNSILLYEPEASILM
jgi:hypothetical protein